MLKFPTKKVFQCIAIFALLVICYNPAVAQKRAMVEAKAAEYRDSIRNEPYPYVLPIFASRVQKKGIDMPLPLGISANYVYLASKLNLTNISLALGNSDYANLDFLKFDKVVNHSNTYNTRLDAWVFPFLNVYGIYAHTNVDSKIKLLFPFEMDIETKPVVNTYGFGTVLAYEKARYFGALNINVSWSDVSSLDHTVFSSLSSLRIGHIYYLPKKYSSISPSIGLQHQHISRKSSGELPLKDIFAKLDPEQLAHFKQQIGDGASAWYDGLKPAEKLVVKQLANAVTDYMEDKSPGDEPLKYRFSKTPLSEWSVQVGVQYNLNRHWWFRTEGGFGKGRQQLFISTNYRFGIKNNNHPTN